MKQEELEQIVSQGETEGIEFKRSTSSRSSAVKTICGMLNGAGGYVIFSVSDDGEIKGQQTSARTLEEIAAELRRIDPPFFPSIETVSTKNNLKTIVIRIPGKGGLYSYDGRPYLRHGPTTIMMPKEEYLNRAMEECHPLRRWETQPVEVDVSINESRSRGDPTHTGPCYSNGSHATPERSPSRTNFKGPWPYRK